MNTKNFLLCCLLLFNGANGMNWMESQWTIKLKSFLSGLGKLLDDTHLPYDLECPYLLNRACQWRDHKHAIMLIESGTPLDIQDERGMTPLHWAASTGLLDVARLLVQRGVSLNTFDNRKLTPLHYAAQNGHVKLLCCLLKNHACIDLQDSSDYSAMHYAASRGQEEIARILINKNANLNLREGKGLTPLHIATSRKNAAMLRDLLEGGADVTIKDNDGKQPLHVAASRGDIESVVLLLLNGAPTDGKDHNGFAPLHYAVFGGYLEVVQLLLKFNAFIDVQDHYGCTPLLYAVGNGNVKLLEVLLKNNADATVSSKTGRTPLHKAAQSTLQEVRLLLSYRAPLDSQTVGGKTPVHYAAQKGKLAILKFLAVNYQFPLGWKLSKESAQQDKVASLKKTCCSYLASHIDILLRNNDVLLVDDVMPLLSKYIVSEAPLSVLRELVAAEKLTSDVVLQAICKRQMRIVQKILSIHDNQNETARHLAKKNGKAEVVEFIDKILKAKDFNELDINLAKEMVENAQKKLFAREAISLSQ